MFIKFIENKSESPVLEIDDGALKMYGHSRFRILANYLEVEIGEGGSGAISVLEYLSEVVKSDAELETYSGNAFELDIIDKTIVKLECRYGGDNAKPMRMPIEDFVSILLMWKELPWSQIIK